MINVMLCRPHCRQLLLGSCQFLFVADFSVFDMLMSLRWDAQGRVHLSRTYRPPLVATNQRLSEPSPFLFLFDNRQGMMGVLLIACLC
jgi:hypothetical protein